MYSNLESVEQLFRQYYKVLRVYAFRFVNDWDIAEDVVQDVFVALWNKRTDIEFDGAVKAYLFKAVYNKSLNINTFFTCVGSVSIKVSISPWSSFMNNEFS